MELKIGEIARKSGVPPSTIRYYVRQGLLPEPTKVNKSMAYYDEGCIEKIQAIRHLQETRYFPLSVIRNILRRMDDGLTLEEAQAIEDAVFGDQANIPATLIDKHEFLKLTGLKEDDLNQALKSSLIMPFIHEKNETLYNQEDVRFARDVLKKIIDYGQDIKGLSFYVELGEAIVDREMALRKKAVQGKSTKENIKITTEISKMADFLRTYIIRRIFQRRIQDTIQKSLSR
ncbi:MAG TPA: MerR family transcriptional regulator [Deltaproteobacteria bacterium]|jgi:DNA-binding transcriptional MerR regulator|nr:MerR family transcriptional regulator [Deltaproteobacteria bacterium]HOI06597.1 MerR family transcriptional regulator [Deltaproteobacteria bacterium]